MKKSIFIILPLLLVLVGCQTEVDRGTEMSVDDVLVNSTEKSVKDDAKVKALQERKPIQEAIPEDTINVPKFVFVEETFDFGTVDEGDVVTHTFKFKNEGKAPLVISNARGSCGCTVPEWPQEPISVGESGEIKVKFNTNGKKNRQKKTVTLTANTWPVKTLISIQGQVTPKEPATTAKIQPQGGKQHSHGGHDHSHDGHNHSHDHSHDGHNHNH